MPVRTLGWRRHWKSAASWPPSLITPQGQSKPWSRRPRDRCSSTGCWWHLWRSWWNSEYMCMESCLHLKKILEVLGGSHNAFYGKTSTPGEWAMVAGSVHFLKKVKEISELWSGDQYPISRRWWPSYMICLASVDIWGGPMSSRRRVLLTIAPECRARCLPTS